jgi:hypothetical protein
MAKGKEGKLRRRQNRQNQRDEDDAARQFLEDADTTTEDSPPPLPQPPRRKEKVVVETVDSDDDDDNENNRDRSATNLPKKKSKVASKSKASSSSMQPVKKKEGIKRTPLILLCCLMGTTLLPLLIYASDYLASHNVLGQVGFRLGIGAVPRRRVLSFYEKHAPEKLSTVPTILASNYGKYPELIKKLERKYQDYGYFIGWEQDEAPLTKALEGLRNTYELWITDYWNRYAPQILKTYFRNARYNLTSLYKRGSKIWKKKIWPLLEPVFGEWNRLGRNESSCIQYVDSF